MALFYRCWKFTGTCSRLERPLFSSVPSCVFSGSFAPTNPQHCRPRCLPACMHYTTRMDVNSLPSINPCMHQLSSSNRFVIQGSVSVAYRPKSSKCSAAEQRARHCYLLSCASEEQQPTKKPHHHTNHRRRRETILLLLLSVGANYCTKCVRTRELHVLGQTYCHFGDCIDARNARKGRARSLCVFVVVIVVVCCRCCY